MKKFLVFLCAILLVFAVAGSAQALVIFDGGTPNQLGGNEMTYWVQAEDFVLNSPNLLLTDAHFWSIERIDSVWDTTLDYYIFGDVEGQPGATPLYSGSGQNVVKTFTGLEPLGFNEYAYSFDLQSPIQLAADTTYWFGLHLSSDWDRDEIYWETTDLDHGAFASTGEESINGSFDNWFNNGSHHAFYLTGNSVPEPATMLLLGSGLIGLGVFGRKKFFKKS